MERSVGREQDQRHVRRGAAQEPEHSQILAAVPVERVDHGVRPAMHDLFEQGAPVGTGDQGEPVRLQNRTDRGIGRCGRHLDNDPWHSVPFRCGGSVVDRRVPFGDEPCALVIPMRAADAS
jgi:hypothetical protein